METRIEKIKKAASKAKSQVRINTNLTDREEILVKELKKIGENVKYVGDYPHTGRSFFVKEMKDAYRINIRCGYGRWNYAPCMEVAK